MKRLLMLVCVICLFAGNVAMATVWTPSEEPTITSEGKWGGAGGMKGTGGKGGGGHKHHK